MREEISIWLIVFAMLRISSTPVVAEWIHAGQLNPVPEVRIETADTEYCAIVDDAREASRCRPGGRGRGDRRWRLAMLSAAMPSG